MTRFIFLLSLFGGQIRFGQSSIPTKTELFKVFKSSIHQTSKRKIETNSNPWLVCNRDSSFFKSDTLYLYDNHNYYYQPENCCDFIGWTFYKENAIIQNDIQICNEPPTAKVTTEKDFYTITLTEERGLTVLKVFRKNQLIETYKVQALENVVLSQLGQTSNRLTLVRHK